MEKIEYLSCAETAKLVRGALKRAFPGVKFSVRSETYSMGASIDVEWTDGPSTAEVNPVARAFAGKRFDGMIDGSTYAKHWLLPDGTAIVARLPGTIGSGGTIETEENDQPAGARLVSFGADYVQCHRWGPLERILVDGSRRRSAA
jgi:conjugative element/phage-associated large polyvalent protein